MRNVVSWMAAIVLLFSFVDSGRCEEKKPSLVTGVDLQQLVSSVFDPATTIANRETHTYGVVCCLLRDGKRVGSIQVGVFGAGADAHAALAHRIKYSSVGPKDDLTGKIGDDRAAAYSPKSIIWTRDNVFIALSVKSGEALPVAKSIDKAIVEAQSGVTRDEKVSVPEIVEIAVPKDVKPGDTTTMTVRIKISARANGDELQFTGPTGSPEMDLGPTEHPAVFQRELTYTIPYRVPKTLKAAWVAYATSGCVVTSKLVPLPDIKE